jgi:CheY-like chemotaxis protein
MAKGTVLIVDDEPSLTSMLRTALEDQDYHVVVSVDGQALQVAHDLRPDVVLLDIMMPGMDGVAVSQRLREDPVTADIPIIAMSAHAVLRTTGTLMPVNERLAKPFSLKDLFAAVARWTHSD